MVDCGPPTGLVKVDAEGEREKVGEKLGQRNILHPRAPGYIVWKERRHVHLHYESRTAQMWVPLVLRPHWYYLMLCHEQH